ncbi:MAG TPA: PH domain-containing protein [Lapillicoccus sp.]|nr:PH domain-containing protein [Lapillicoccus sp.]
MVSDEDFRPFRSRRGRLVATVMAVLSLVVFVTVAVLLPSNAGLTTWQPADRALVVGLGVIIALVCWRYASIRAVPSLDGLVVRNLVVTRTVAWAQVIDVEFGDGAPWVTLELDDTDTLAVMAIQRADGPAAMAEAQRLATLVRDLGEAR